MTTQVRERLEKELTKFVEQRRADYLRLKAADTQITSAELSSARTAYEHALKRLSRFVTNAKVVAHHA